MGPFVPSRAQSQSKFRVAIPTSKESFERKFLKKPNTAGPGAARTVASRKCFKVMNFQFVDFLCFSSCFVELSSCGLDLR